jgi:hypothetical protein
MDREFLGENLSNLRLQDHVTTGSGRKLRRVGTLGRMVVTG